MTAALCLVAAIAIVALILVGIRALSRLMSPLD